MRSQQHVIYVSVILISGNEAGRMPIHTMNHTSRQVCNFGFVRRGAAALFCGRTKRICINSHRPHFRHPKPSFIPQSCKFHDTSMPLIRSRGLFSTCNLQTDTLSMENGDDKSQSSTNLAVVIKESYATGETDGVRAALNSINIPSELSANLNSEEVASLLIDAAIKAAEKDRGSLGSMLNSILASCCRLDNTYPQISLAILNGIDKMHSMDETSMVAPDIVSLLLVYYTLNQASEQKGGVEELGNASQTILERAQKLAKKAAGSQRRKELNMERRRGSNFIDIDSKQLENNLQSLYGPDIRVLHETSDVIVVSKPAGMVCYHTKRTGAGKITSSRKKSIRATNANESNSINNGAKWMDISLVDALIDSSVSLSTLNPSARGIVHRLDRGTSGSLILAKSDESHLILTALFFLRKVEKTYLALVSGCNNQIVSGLEDEDMKQNIEPLSVGSSGVIDVPVDGRPARSTYRVVDEYGSDEQSTLPNALLLEVATLTGRKHQVRVHCASLGHPILLDPLYPSSNVDQKSKSSDKGQKKRHKSSPTPTNEMDDTVLAKAVSDLLLDNSQHQQERFFLHAASLSVKELGISVNAPLPRWWVDFTSQLT